MDFTKDVIERSRRVPVVVDFWAPWCGPCRFLGPVIEELAGEAGDRWELVKINTDENPDLMNRYQIRGIPAVKLFVNGDVKAEFAGALPKHQILQWLDEHLPDERKERLEEIKRRLKGGDNSAQKDLQELVDEHPDLEEARVLFASQTVLQDPEMALDLVSNIKPGNPLFDQAESIRNLAALFDCKFNENEKLADKLERARTDLKQNNMGSGLQRLIEAVSIDKHYCDDLPRKASIALFNILGPDHELTKKYRRQFDMALY